MSVKIRPKLYKISTSLGNPGAVVWDRRGSESELLTPSVFMSSCGFRVLSSYRGVWCWGLLHDSYINLCNAFCDKGKLCAFQSRCASASCRQLVLRRWVLLSWTRARVSRLHPGLVFSARLQVWRRLRSPVPWSPVPWTRIQGIAATTHLGSHLLARWSGKALSVTRCLKQHRHIHMHSTWGRRLRWSKWPLMQALHCSITNWWNSVILPVWKSLIPLWWVWGTGMRRNNQTICASKWNWTSLYHWCRDLNVAPIPWPLPRVVNSATTNG